MARHLVASLALAALATRVSAQYDLVYDRWAPINSTINWVQCSGFDGGIGYECGYLDVPMDYANSSAGKAVLAVSKYPYSVEPRLGTLFVNPGGPGDAGTDIVFEMGVNLSSYSGGHYDIVAWDPRGTGNTYPIVNCFNSSDEEVSFWQNTIPENGIEAKGNFTSPDYNDPDVVAFWAQEPEVDDLLSKLGDLCLQRNPDILPYVGTPANVRDILSLSDSIDGAGGLIHYWGFSYGTVIGNMLTNMFPERVGRLIVDGVVNPQYYAGTQPYEIWSYQIQDTENVLAGFTSSCAQAGPTGCPIAWKDATSETIRLWILGLMDSAYDYYKAGGQFGSSYVRNTIFQAMYHPTNWPDLASTLYEIADFLYTGNNTSTNFKRDVPFGLEPKSHIMGIPRRSNKPSAFRRAMYSADHAIHKRAEPEMYDYSFQAITCADAVDADGATTNDVFSEIVYASINSSAVFGPSFSIGGFYCHKWPVRAVERYAGPWNNTANLKNPIIVIGNEADPITPLPGAEFVASTLGDGVHAYLVKQDDYGHCSLAEHSDCTIAIVSAFFTNGTYPTDDQQCATNQVLFPVASITKQSLNSGFVDPSLNPSIAVPGSAVFTGSGTPSVNAADDSAPTVTTTTTATVTATSGWDQTAQDEINKLKDDRRTLWIAVAALGGALALVAISTAFIVLRSNRKSRGFTSSGMPIVGGGGRRNKGHIPVNLTDNDDDHEDAFLPPMKEDRGLVVHHSDDSSPRASMETLKAYGAGGGGGYTDPYDPPSGALGSSGPTTALRLPSTGGASSSRPSSPNYRYSDAGAEYKDGR